MKLFLVQHGESVAKEIDEDRPLSDTGAKDVEQMAARMRKVGVNVRRVAHSGKTRAEQTAQLLASAVCTASNLEELPGLAPLDPVAGIALLTEQWTEDTLLAGHQPFMGKLAAHLLCGDEEAVRFGFVPGTVVCLERGEERVWTLSSMSRPGDL